jgi:hypothetical protein
VSTTYPVRDNHRSRQANWFPATIPLQRRRCLPIWFDGWRSDGFTCRWLMQKSTSSAHLKRVADDDGVWRLDLPAKSVAGLPGRTADLTDPESMPKNLLGRITSMHFDRFGPIRCFIPN